MSTGNSGEKETFLPIEGFCRSKGGSPFGTVPIAKARLFVIHYP